MSLQVAECRSDGAATLERGEERWLVDSRQCPPQREAQHHAEAFSSNGEHTAPARFDVDDLMDRLLRDSVLKVPDPTAEVRAGYRRAISRIITSGQVPAGHRLRHAGRDRGDLVIRLVAYAPDDAKEPPLPVPVPDTLGDVHPAVTAVVDDARVGGEAQDRAVRILHGIAIEAERRGYRFMASGERRGGFAVAVGDDRFEFALVEETQKVSEVAEADLAAVKYSWQRVHPEVRVVGSGRLALELHELYRYRPARWADRNRWTLIDKLPEILRYIEDQARASQLAREQAQAEARAHRTAWETAVLAARDRYSSDLTRDRIAQQVATRRRALEMREYSAELAILAETFDDEEPRAAVTDWAARVNQEADRIDPLLHRDELRLSEPEPLPRDLDPYMPTGMRASQPPLDPDAVPMS